MQLLFSLKKEMGMAMLFISHDLALVGGICDRVCVLHDGQLVEELPGGRKMYEKAENPYTRLLMKSVLDIIYKISKSRYKMRSILEVGSEQLQKL